MTRLHERRYRTILSAPSSKSERHLKYSSRSMPILMCKWLSLLLMNYRTTFYLFRPTPCTAEMNAVGLLIASPPSRCSSAFQLPTLLALSAGSFVRSVVSEFIQTLSIQTGFHIQRTPAAICDDFRRRRSLASSWEHRHILSVSLNALTSSLFFSAFIQACVISSFHSWHHIQR